MERSTPWQLSRQNNSWLKHVKRLTARPGDQAQATFSLPQHVEDSLSALESSDKICEYFSSISQEYTPLDTETLPQRVRSKLANDPCNHPYLADHSVYEGLKKGKKTCSVPGDIPTKILDEFLPEFTAPVAASTERLCHLIAGPSLSRKNSTSLSRKYPSPSLKMTSEILASLPS